MHGHATLILKPGKERSLQRRHPWLYDTAIARVSGRPVSGETVAVRSHDGQWLAWGAFSPASTIRARLWSFAESDQIDDAWLAGRVAAAVARRAHLVPASDALRLVFGEADGLPGLIADRYHDQLVVQFQAAGVDAHREPLLDALTAATGCGNVFDRSDGAARRREGLEPASGVLRGAEPPARIAIREHARRSWVDVRSGHKTGYYIDQRDNRELAASLAARLRRTLGRDVRALNCFCYTGGFTVALAQGGAAQVQSIDSSAGALAMARENWSLNSRSSLPAIITSNARHVPTRTST
jgi:23S rRNA (cytosine1962-C5)-methyltransferase